MPIRSKLLIFLSTSFPLRPSSSTFRVARYSDQPLAAFSSAAVSHGRHRPLYVFPKLGFWMQEASQFNTQAAVKEGCGEAAASLAESKDPHPWTEWSKLSDLLLEKGYSYRGKAAGHDDDSFLMDEDLPEEFLKAAEACLGFARERTDILRLLSKRNVEAVVLNGSPFLFKNGENSASRMRLFLTGEDSNELELGKAESVDIMRYLLSYVYGPLSLSAGKNLKVDEPVERSVRKLLVELFNLGITVWKPKSIDATKIEPPLSNGHFSRPPEQYNDSRTGSWTSPNNTSYGRFTANSSQPPGNSWNNYQSYSRDTVNSTQPSSGSLSNSSTFYGRPSPNSSQPPGNSWNSYSALYAGYSMNTTQPSSTSWSSGNTATPSDSQNNYNTSYGVCSANSTEPSSSSWADNNSSCGGFTPNSSQPHKNSWNKYNTSYGGHTTNPTQPSSNPWTNSNSSYDRSTQNLSQPPSEPWNNYSTQYDGYIAKSEESSSSSWSNNNKSSGGFTNSSSQQPSNSWNNYNTSHGGCSAALSSAALSSSWNNSSTSYSASSENSSQPPRESWNDYKTQCGGHAVKSSEPSSNSGSYNASFGWSTESSQPPYDSWNNHNKNTCYRSSSSGSSANSYHDYAAKSNQPSSNSWNNNSTYNYESNQNPSHPSCNAWNNSRKSWGSGFPQGNSVTGNLPKQAETQNACENGSFGYSGKSLEGSCVKEPDPLDMSEEAKAERWFRRVAQIKDIQELSQIPDEDFPQIMPMRKGVNRFVITKRKTPLERRLALQQYKRNMPVVSSEPEKESTDGDGTT